MMRLRRSLGDAIEDSLEPDSIVSYTDTQSSGASSVVPSGSTSYSYAGPQPPPGSYVDAFGRTVLPAAFLAQQAAAQRAAQAAPIPWGIIAAAGAGLLALVVVMRQ